MKIYRTLWGCALFCAVAFTSSAQKSPLAKSSVSQTNGKPNQYSKVSEHLMFIYYGNLKQINPESQIHMNTDLYLMHNGKVRIEASAVKSGSELAIQLKGAGATDISAFKRKINAWVPIENIPLLQELSSLQYVEVVFRVSPEVGLANSEADSAMAVGIANRQYCLDGSGMKIGVLSDTYDANFGAASGVSSGDLPGTGNPNGHITPVTVVVDDFTGIDEGRAMCELIHDLAPAAALYFNTANLGQASFANGILNLANVHQCDVITDDIRYFEEPFYMDGVIAQACDKVFDMGIPYFASAGNYAQSSYESPFNPTPNGRFHDFDPGPGVDSMQLVSVVAPSNINLSLQWDDPWGSLTPNSPQTDLDLFIYNSTGTTMLISSDRDNSITLEPTEFIGAQTNGGGTVSFNIAIRRYSGPMPSMLKWVIRNANGLVIHQFTTPTTNGQATGYGHSNAEGANAIGACAWFNSPAYGVDPAQPESFTSSGGVQIRYDTTGAAITPITRNKPNFTATDGVSNTFFGSGNKFYGTSAAAPNAAAVALLMLQADPALTPSEVRSMMGNSALDMSSPGFDFLTGAGLVQADSALSQVYDDLCNFNSIVVQTPPAMEPGDTTYSVGLSIAFSGAICTDSLRVNGQNFELTGSLFQNVMLTGLPADGQPVDATASFTRSASCTLTVNALFTALGAGAALKDTLVITEIMYDSPESGADSLEFIEIYNPTASQVNMSGYSFTEGINYTFGNVVIAAGGYVVVCEDSVALFNQFAVSAYEWGGVNALTNGGEDIVLKDNNSNTLDSVDYDDIAPWPTNAGGDGPSIVLCDWTGDNNLGASWTESTSGTGIIINGKELKGSPGAADFACSACPAPDSTTENTVSCDPAQAGTSYTTYSGSDGCDSVHAVVTTYDAGSTTNLPDEEICEGGSVMIFGELESMAGTYFDTLPNQNGCDSILSVQLTVHPVDTTYLSSTTTDPASAGQFTSTLTSQYGCDSVVISTITYLPPACLDPDSTTENTVSCDPAQAGTSYTTFSGSDGCDSVHAVVTTYVPLPVTFVTSLICAGDSLYLEQAWRTTAGTYMDTLTAANGCDSTVTTTLSFDSTGCHYDCNGDLNGSAYYDTCGICVGGNTGLQPCSSTCVPLEIVSFSLIDAVSGVEIKVLTDGETIDKSLIGPFSVRANTCSGPVGSVLFSLNGVIVQMENSPPYDINGGTTTIPHPWSVAAGPYHIKATPSSQKNMQGIMGIAKTVNINVVDSTYSLDCNGVLGGSAYFDSCGVCVAGNTGKQPCTAACASLEVVSFVLMNASNGSIIRPLNNGDVIDKGTIGSFSIRALTCNGTVGSVLFELNGSVVSTENQAPYDMNGGTTTKPNPWNSAPGNYSLVGRPYSQANGRGSSGIAETVNFSVMDAVSLNLSWGNTMNGQGNAEKELKEGEFSAGAASLHTEEGPQALPMEVNLYPNPTSGKLKVVLTRPSGVAEIHLIDLTGKLIHKAIQPAESLPGYLIYNLDLQLLPQGIYLVQIHMGDEVFNRRLIRK